MTGVDVALAGQYGGTVMEKAGQSTLRQLRVAWRTLAPLLSMVLLLETTAVHSQETAEPKPARAGEGPVKGERPVDVFRSYLEAIKRNDLAAAKACW